jgi:hypothetical protein
MLGLHDAIVPPGHLKDEPLSNPAGVDRSKDYSDEGRHVRESDKARSEIVWRWTQDKGRRVVEDTEPDNIRAIREARVKYNRKYEED